MSELFPEPPQPFWPPWRSADERKRDYVTLEEARRCAQLCDDQSSRGVVIGMLADWVSRRELRAADAERVLLEWDAVVFPKQVPLPIREWLAREALTRNVKGGTA